MSISIYEAVWCAEFEGMEKLVLLRLAEHAAKDGSRIYPGVESIAAYCGIGEKTVRRAINALKESGVLVLVKSGTLLERTANEYRIDLKKLGAKKNPNLDKKEGKKRRRGKPQKKRNERQQATEITNDFETLGGHTDRRKGFALGGHSDRRSAVTQSTLGGHSDHPTRPIEPVIVNPSYGSLRSPDARNDENPAREILTGQASPIISGQIVAAAPPQEAFRKTEPNSGAKPTEVSISSLAGTKGDCASPRERRAGAKTLTATTPADSPRNGSTGFSVDLARPAQGVLPCLEDLSKPKRENNGSRIPADWTPDAEEINFARGLGLTDGQIARAVDEFRDYWVGVPGAKGRKLDWAATFRNKIRWIVDRLSVRPGFGLAGANAYDAAKPGLDRLRAAAARGPKTDISGI
jgi:hypothetical protein